jgi:hypothetical protein
MFTTVGPTASANWLKLAGTMGGSIDVVAQAGGVKPPPDSPMIAIPARIIAAATTAAAYLPDDISCLKPISQIPPLTPESMRPIHKNIIAATEFANPAPDGPP